jgi:hypothetical protein
VGDELASGSSLSASDDWSGSCVTGAGGHDVTYSWTAPSDGCYGFSTNGSSYDTVLMLRDSCDGTEIDCDDDGGLGITSYIEAELSSGTELLIVVDGYEDGITGTYVLDIESLGESILIDSDLGSATGSPVITGSSSGMDDTLTASCAPSASDVLYSWAAPTYGTYTFSLTDTSFDSVLSLHETGSCGDVEIACDDDPSFGRDSITTSLLTDQEIVIRIAGWGFGTSGSYELHITGP